MLEALDRALTAAEEARVLVIEGRERVFCAGLDLPALLPQGRAEVRACLAAFDRVFDRLLAFPRALIMAARGPAVAGGAILLCAGDDRLVPPVGKVGLTAVTL